MRYGPSPLRARLIDDREWGHSETADVVYVTDDGVVPTGIYGPSGMMIWRYRDPVGFRLTQEES